ncbi:MAG TPA: GGDEF domain-containing protein [Pirellulales bacterium]|jgi:diguanylate cyclase (GGDEF)-like protein|nr:GGDEF domain-containing protein [Pirellulales bacterium]
MNPLVLTSDGRSRSIAGLRQAVLDALPEALFLVDSSTEELRALNAAADTWLPSHQGIGSWMLADLLPELQLSSLVDSISGFVLSRAIDPGTDELREVMLHLYPLADAERELSAVTPENHSAVLTDERKLTVLGLRPIGGAADGGMPRRDAFDDAFHDPLTRLPNRRLFQRRLERIIERAGRMHHCFAVLFVDLDRFKSVNDQYGHVLGDKLLVNAAHRLVEAVRPQDMVARRDGDEFIILLDDLDQPADAINVAERILEHLHLPFALDGTGAGAITIGASIGIATAADGVLTAEELISRADAAMYNAKARGGGAYLAEGPLPDRCELSPPRNSPKPR